VVIYRDNKGITLMELLVVVLIVGVLASVAVPIYTSYMQRARRSDAKTCLEQLRASQEMRRAEQGSYSTSITELQSTWGLQTSCGQYTLVLNSTTATSFLGVAQPTAGGPQVSDGNLYINNFGDKWDNQGIHYPAGKWAK
jgi:type IV pilus assembly protein PilE